MKNLSGEESAHEDTPPKEYAVVPSKRKRFWLLLTQRWPEYVVEIIVVIIGITISFAISNYQRDSTDRRVAQIYLQDLGEDIKFDILALRETIQQTDSVILSGHSLISQNGSKRHLTKEGFVDRVRTIIRRPNFISKNATFSSLKTSATFQLIKDIELRKLLFEYDQVYQTIKAMELAELQATVTIAGPYFIKSIPLIDTPRSLYWLEKLDVDAILGSVEFMNNVALRIDNREELLRSYKEILETALLIDKGIQRNLQ
jgi:hypothetical protein